MRLLRSLKNYHFQINYRILSARFCSEEKCGTESAVIPFDDVLSFDVFFGGIDSGAFADDDDSFFPRQQHGVVGEK